MNTDINNISKVYQVPYDLLEDYIVFNPDLIEEIRVLKPNKHEVYGSVIRLMTIKEFRELDNV